MHKSRVFFYTLLLIVYLSIIEALFCLREIEFNRGSSVYMGILAQLFKPFLPPFSFLNQRLDHFSNPLKNLKHSYVIRLIK